MPVPRKQMNMQPTKLRTEHNDPIYIIDVQRLHRTYGSPLFVSQLLWDCKVTREMVDAHTKNGTERTEPWNEYGNAEMHAARIAYFVKHGFTDHIELDFGVPQLGYHPKWICTDGNHRLAAAIIRDDATVNAIVSGSLSALDYLERETFGFE